MCELWSAVSLVSRVSHGRLIHFERVSVAVIEIDYNPPNRAHIPTNCI